MKCFEASGFAALVAQFIEVQNSLYARHEKLISLLHFRRYWSSRFHQAYGKFNLQIVVPNRLALSGLYDFLKLNKRFVHQKIE